MHARFRSRSEEERLYYYEPNPKFIFKSLEEKREFKRRVRRSLELLGYRRDRDFLRDLYEFLAQGRLEEMIEYLQRRLEASKLKHA